MSEEKEKTARPARTPGHLEKEEAKLWRLSLLFMVLLATGLAALSWERLQNLPSSLFQRRKRPRIIVLHETAVADHVSGHNGCETTLDAFLGHAPPVPLENTVNAIVLAQFDRVYRAPDFRNGSNSAESLIFRWVGFASYSRHASHA